MSAGPALRQPVEDAMEDLRDRDSDVEHTQDICDTNEDSVFQGTGLVGRVDVSDSKLPDEVAANMNEENDEFGDLEISFDESNELSQASLPVGKKEPVEEREDEPFDDSVPEPPADEDYLHDDFFDAEIDDEAYLKAGIFSDDADDFGEDLGLEAAGEKDEEIAGSRVLVACTPSPPKAGSRSLPMDNTDGVFLVESTPPGGASQEEGEGDDNVCPVCSASLKSMKDLVAASHVNRCLDRGSATPSQSQKRRRSEKGAISIGSTPEGASASAPAPEIEKKPPPPAKQKSLMNFFDFSGGQGGDTAMQPKEPEPPLETSRWAPWGARGGSGRPVPFYKKVPGTNFYIDAFGFGEIPGATGYFLTHFHSDHFGGLTKQGKAAPIYCSRVTANLVLKQIRVAVEKIVELPFEGEMMVPDGPGKNVKVQTIDANHCPGSVLMLFHVSVSGSTKTYLHCGDMRATESMLSHPFLRLPHPLDVLFLDTTYAKPDHRFPPQERVVETVCEVVRRGVFDGANVKDVVREETGRIRRDAINGGNNSKSKGMMGGLLGWFTNVVHQPKPKKTAEAAAVGPSKGSLDSFFIPSTRPANPNVTTLVVCGSYQIGKERLYKALATTLGTKIFADGSKRGLLECQEDAVLSELLTADPTKAAVHVVGMGSINVDALLELLSKVKSKGAKFERVLGIRPTGWTWTAKGRGMPNSAQGNSPNRNFNIQHLKPYQPHSLVTILDVPYSEHSSFTELEMLVTGLAGSVGVRKCVPTVGGGREGWREAAGWCDRWVARANESKAKKEVKQEE